jgi:hypothetical protein
MSKEIEIEKALGVIDKVIPQEVVVEKKEIVMPSNGEDIDNDYEYQRRNFYNLVERGTMKLPGTSLNRLLTLLRNLVNFKRK